MNTIEIQKHCHSRIPSDEKTVLHNRWRMSHIISSCPRHLTAAQRMERMSELLSSIFLIMLVGIPAYQLAVSQGHHEAIVHCLLTLNVTVLSRLWYSGWNEGLGYRGWRAAHAVLVAFLGDMQHCWLFRSQYFLDL